MFKKISLTLFSLFILLHLWGCGDTEPDPGSAGTGAGVGAPANTQAEQKILDEKTLELLKKYGLHQAAALGDLEAVQAFIDAGAPLEETDGFQGQIPLHWAAKQGHPKVVEAFLKAGVDPDKKDKFLEYTALHFAAVNGGSVHVEVVRVLLKWKADPNAKDEDGDTPLHAAAAKGYAEIVTVLLSASNIDLTIQNADGKTAKDVAKDDTIKALFPSE